MPRGPVVASPVPGAVPQNPGDVIQSSVWNATVEDVYNILNTIQPIEYGGTGVADNKPLDNSFGVKNSADLTKIGVFNASNLPTATTRTYDLPYYSGTLGLVSDIRGQIYGLTLSNNVTDATNDIDIAAGSAVDSTGTRSMVLVSAITKRLDASWAVGTNQGGLDTGSIGNAWYYVFLIERPDTGVVDVLFSLSATSPTLPTNYTLFRRIGAILRSTNIIPFYQDGDRFLFKVPLGDVAVTNPGTSGVLRSLNVPPSVDVTAILSLGIIDASADGNTVWYYVSSPYVTASVASSSVFSTFALASSGSIGSGSTFAEVPAASGQVRTLVSSSDTGITIYISTLGYMDRRGQ